ncbi:MAG: transpeptidase family protein [Muribaculaceae bacterium]|nr:transpeptidase family protein [Muribaculaceae bacterium]
MNNRLLIILRYAFISLVILVVSARVIYKMVDTTVIHADDWNARAMEELSKITEIDPERGDILDAKGRILATNLRYYTLRMDLTGSQFRDVEFRDSLGMIVDSLALHYKHRTREGWAEHLNKALELRKQWKANVEKLKTDPDNKELRDATHRLRSRLRSWPILVKVTFSEINRAKGFNFFRINHSAKTGLIVEPTVVRTKPYGDLARQSIGLVGDDSLGKKRGKSGLEGALDSLLYGIPGSAKKVATTRNFSNWTDTAAIPGYNVLTTIDIDIQDIVETELMRILDTCSAEWGTAVLMEVKTGDIKAISNLKQSNGRYVEGINHAVRPYEPGSVIKPISMMIALEDGLVRNLDEAIPTGGSWAYLGKNPIKDSHAHGSVPVRDVICYSSNIATAKIILRGYEHNPEGFPQRLADMGFMEPLGIGIRGESAPRINPHPKKIDLSRMAYGYTTELPPLHTLSMYNAIANGGKYVRPRLYSKLIGTDTIIDLPVTYIRDSVCSARNAAILREMIHDVVWKDGGTGRLVRSKVVDIAGKTGTCYMVEGRGYNTSKKRLAFCGFFPYDNPKYSCIVLTCNPRRNMRGAASTSGQVMKNIALKLHARGLLDNSGDYKADTHPDTHATLYATTGSEPYMDLSGWYRLSGPRRGKTPAVSGDGQVPRVLGLSLREAVNVLEDAGYQVMVEGDGYVSRQLPAAGDSIPPGATVRLHLTQDT